MNSIKMIKVLAFLSAILLLAYNAAAANWYVRPSATGSSNGTDWNNAWPMPGINWSTIRPGDTIWIAGGTHSGMGIGASGTSSAPILIYRATTNDAAATGAAGWQSSFDSQIIISPGGSIDVPGPVSYVTLSGRTQSGIFWSSPSSGAYNGFSHGATNGNIDHITFQYIECTGINNTTGSNGPTYGINWAPQNYSVTNCTIDHCILHDMSEPLRAAVWTNVVVQYCTIHDTNNFGDHEDVIYFYPSHNCIFRYNTIYNSPNDGVYFGNGLADHFYFYGNVYYKSQFSLIAADDGPVFIYNNVFAAPSASNYGLISGKRVTSAAQIYNNIFWNVSSDFAAALSDYNAYNYTSLNGFGWPSNEAHSFTFTANPFTNLSNGDFHLTAAAQAQFQNGIALAADGLLNKDLDGNTRGNPWYIGPYQYGGSSAAPVPSAPTNLHIVPTR
jgi:Right handed beta helix region